MAAEENHDQHGKRSRVSAGSGYGIFLPDADAAGGERKMGVAPWHHHPSSRIYRVSRASGGKDRHSKVVTAKGIRDRRVRLSVSTAIQFYDLQDRLGLDQPSKAIEWLIKAASAAIDKLPSLDGAFAEAAKPGGLAQDQKALDHGSGEGQPATQSGCSSTSETSKGSVLSLSRSESLVKAKERASRDKEMDVDHDDHRGGVNASQGASFTQLLTGHAVTTAYQGDTKLPWQICHPAANYLGQASDLFSHPRKSTPVQSGFTISGPGAAQFGSNIGSLQMAAPPYGFTVANGGASDGGEHTEMTTQFSFLQDHLIHPTAVPSPAAASGDYNLGFSISSSLVGATRGTLQSNSTTQPQFGNRHQQLQMDGAGAPFFFGTPVEPAAAPNTGENHFSAVSGLQLWDGYRQHSDLKEKGKN